MTDHLKQREESRSEGTTDGEPASEGQDGPVNWDRLLDLAHRNAISPLVAVGIKRCTGLPMPEWVADHFEQHARRVAIRNLFLAGELHKLLRLFESHGIRAIPFKGPTLAVEAYGNLSSREFLDLDLLISRSELEQALQLAGEMQYLCISSVPLRDMPAHLRRFRQIRLVRADGLSTVELHTDFTSPGFAYHYDIDLLWHNRKQIDLCGHAIPTLNTEELLLYLCVHGGNHLWERFAWICDVAALIAAQTPIDWDYVLKQASQRHIERLLLLALHLAEDLAGVTGTREIQRRMASDQTVELLVPNVWKRLFRKEQRVLGAFETVCFDLRARERLRDGLRYALEKVFSPTLLDYKYVPFRNRFRILSYVVRPLRLAGNYAWKALFPPRRDEG